MLPCARAPELPDCLPELQQILGQLYPEWGSFFLSAADRVDDHLKVEFFEHAPG